MRQILCRVLPVAQYYFNTPALEGFDSTRRITVLLRTAGMEESNTGSKERAAAVGRVCGLWGRAVATVRGGASSSAKDVDEPE